MNLRVNTESPLDKSLCVIDLGKENYSDHILRENKNDWKSTNRKATLRVNTVRAFHETKSVRMIASQQLPKRKFILIS